MPLNIDPALIDGLVQRQIAQEDSAKRWAPRTSEKETDLPEPEGSLSPSLVAVLGALADGASTYRFLKQKTGVEGNAMYGGLGNHPEKTGTAVAGLGVGAALLGRLLKGKIPRPVADAVLANLGANQAGLGAYNTTGTPFGSQQAYDTRITQAIAGR